MKQGTIKRNPLLYGFVLFLSAGAVIAMIVGGDFERKDVATGLLALVGTFVGALLAFRLQSYAEDLKESARRKAALNRAILVLGAQQNEIRTFQNELSRFPRVIDRALNMPASQPPELFELRQRIDELAFLIEEDKSQLVFDLFIEQMRFDQAMQMIRHRNSFYVHEVQHRMAQTLPRGTIATEDELRQKLGERLFDGAILAVESVAHHINGSIESIPEAMQKLRATAKALYPEYKFLDFEPAPFPREEGAAPSPTRPNPN